MKAKLLAITLLCFALLKIDAQTYDYTETLTNYGGDGTFASSGTGLSFDWTATNTSTPAITLDKNSGSLVSTSISTSISNLFINVTADNGSNSVLRVDIDGTTTDFTPEKGTIETLVVGNLNLSSGFTINLEVVSGNKGIQINSISWNTYDGEKSIYNIQYTATAGSSGTYPSLFVDSNFKVTGAGDVIVTAIKQNASSETIGYYIQDVDGSLDGSSNASDWHGIYVEDATTSPSVLDIVEVTGKVAENNGRTEIQSASAVITGTGSAINANMVFTALGEEDESVVSFITYSRYGSGAGGNLIMNIGFTTPVISISVDNDLFTIPTTPAASNYYGITGPVNYASSSYSISPRDLTDFTDEGIATIGDFEKTSNSRISSIQNNIIIGADQTYSLEVYNLAGQKVIDNYISEGRTEIQMKKGVYIVKLNAANYSIIKKVSVR